MLRIRFDAIPSARASLRPPSQRLHGLDALRAVALLLGVVLHSVLPFASAPGEWAVGTRDPLSLLGWLVYYLHSFRLELFFLMAGFFGAFVIEQRGAAAYLRDRVIRVLLVFLVALYPTKFLLQALWIRGGLETGWLVLPPQDESRSLLNLTLAGLRLERWPNLNLTHLWFLYTLFCLSVLFVAARTLLSRAPRPAGLAGFADGLGARLARLASSRAAPLVLAVVVTPLLAMMKGTHIDTPDTGFAWNGPVTALYGMFFLLGAWLHGRRELLPAQARHFKAFLIVGFLLSWVGAAGVGLRAREWSLHGPHSQFLLWATSLCTALVMTTSVLGGLGYFVARFERPSPRLRYLADASYWVYIAHLPLLVALQVWWALWGLPWWVQVPLSNALVLLVLLPLYHWGIRYTWLGAWLNGRRHAPAKSAHA
jgi:peptidoglycan/LPS O-acetylase OafA/YrhL